MKTIVPGFLLLLLIVPLVLAEGIWHSYSNIGDIHDIEAQGDYIWCATSGGAVRVDTRDKTYSVFRTQDSLVDNYIRTLAIDSTGVVWFGTFKGISLFDGEVWITLTEENGLIENIVSDIAVRSDNIKYITYDGLHHTDIPWWHTYCLQSYDGSEFKTLFNSKDFYFQGSISVYVDEKNNCLWVGTGIGSNQHSLDGQKIKFHTSMGDNSGKVPYALFDLATDNDKVTWVASDKLWNYNGTEWTQFTESNYGFPGGIVRSVTVTSDNVKWIGSTAGLFRYDGTNWSVFPLEEGGL